MAKKAIPQNLKSQITKMTKIVLAYLVIRLAVRNKTLCGKAGCALVVHPACWVAQEPS